MQMQSQVSWVRVAHISSGILLLSLIGFLILHGFSYYSTPVVQRFRSPLHPDLKPGGDTGRYLGMTGSGMMLGLLVYSVRKRVRVFRNVGKLSQWLHFHILLGVTGPVLITFHTAFKLRGIVAISYWSMVIVFISGLIGRYLYAQVTSAASDRTIEFEELRGNIQSVNSRLLEILDPVTLKRVQAIADFHSDPSLSPLKAGLLILTDDLRRLWRRRKLRQILKGIPGAEGAHRNEILGLARKRELLLRRITLLRSTQQLFKYWHIFHLPLAQTMYITMAIHILVAVLTGYV